MRRSLRRHNDIAPANPRPLSNLPLERRCHNGTSEGERQLGSKALERGFFNYGGPSLVQNPMSSYGRQPVHRKRLKVAALNLFHPTASLPFPEAAFSYEDFRGWAKARGASACVAREGRIDQMSIQLWTD